eukprot:gene726-13_t
MFDVSGVDWRPRLPRDAGTGGNMARESDDRHTMWEKGTIYMRSCVNASSSKASKTVKENKIWPPPQISVKELTKRSKVKSFSAWEEELNRQEEESAKAVHDEKMRKKVELRNHLLGDTTISKSKHRRHSNTMPQDTARRSSRQQIVSVTVTASPSSAATTLGLSDPNFLSEKINDVCQKVTAKMFFRSSCVIEPGGITEPGSPMLRSATGLEMPSTRQIDLRLLSKLVQTPVDVLEELQNMFTQVCGISGGSKLDKKNFLWLMKDLGDLKELPESLSESMWSSQKWVQKELARTGTRIDFAGFAIFFFSVIAYLQERVSSASLQLLVNIPWDDMLSFACETITTRERAAGIVTKRRPPLKQGTTSGMLGDSSGRRPSRYAHIVRKSQMLDCVPNFAPVQQQPPSPTAEIAVPSATSKWRKAAKGVATSSKIVSTNTNKTPRKTVKDDGKSSAVSATSKNGGSKTKASRTIQASELKTVNTSPKPVKLSGTAVEAQPRSMFGEASEKSVTVMFDEIKEEPSIVPEPVSKYKKKIGKNLKVATTYF